MYPLVQRSLSATLVVCALILTACGTSQVTMGGSLNDEPFVRVARAALTADGGPEGYASAENFYLAVHKSQLSQRWFLSAYLTQWHPSQNLPVRSLGTRVVSFKLQNGKLFVFDATEGSKWSDVLDPTLVVEAYPVVANFAPFNALAGSSNYVLFDPSAGLNRFDVVADDFAASHQVRFQVDLSYLQRYRVMSDGVAFEQVFTGSSELPGPGILGWDQPFRGSGTMAIALRRYTEGAGFVAAELTSNHFFGSRNLQYVPNQPRFKRNVVKWNIKPGMAPIPWRITQSIERLKSDPRLAGIDVEGALARGVTNWNSAFGFPVFTVVPTTAADSFGDDDKNFIVVDTNPGAGLAFANWRENPNTGEIRGASVYFSSIFVEGALQSAGDAGIEAPVDAGTVEVDAGSPPVACAPGVVISHVYGGNSATGFRNQDFVELHNRTNDPQSVTGMSLQYGSSSGTSAWQVVQLTGVIAPGGSYLVGFATTTGGTPIPTPDQTSGINLSASAGKLALTLGGTPLTGACPISTVIDAVGYGTTNCSELRPASAGSTTAGLVRRDLGCTDTQDNSLDFASSAVEPRNTSAAPAFCSCTAPALIVTAPSGDGGVQLIAPNQAVSPTLRWSALPDESICAMRTDFSKAIIPAGMTRKEFLEKVLTHTVLHEIGHTLGLRHNFKGSLEGSSVMDYTRDEDAALMVVPGSYDVAAVKFLYGQTTTAPSQAFCTDDSTLVDAQCDRFDSTSNPLTLDRAPRFRAQVRHSLATGQDLTLPDVFALTRYVRAPVSEAQRLEAFNALVSEVAPPLRADVLALGPHARAIADIYNALFLTNLFLDPAARRDEIGVNPYLEDPAFRARVIEVAKNSLLSSDNQRSFETMRLMVDVLKAMQHADALAALNSARASLVATRPNWPASVQPLADDLIRRIDVACSPYFQ
ncbi:MAG: zinc-dependent metalloprotease [Archangium sp.]|nr:zinc-dependent metalloprotease [Archangium sp.]